jgi:outer membrane protein assembly factor BamB
MKKKSLSRVLLFFAAALLTACSDNNKIGTTIKGERLAVIEQAKTISPDKEFEGVKPTLSQEIVNLSWPQGGYDSEHAMPRAQASAHPRIVWETSLGEGSNADFKLLAEPVVSRGVVYTMDAEGLVSSFDAKNGKEKWERDTAPQDDENPAIGGGLAVDGDTVYATTGKGFVCALQAKTGEIKWRKALLKPLRAAPTVADGRVYVVSIDNELNALNAANGEILWHQSGIAESATLMGASSPAVQGDFVAVAYTSGEIFSLRVQNGRMSWNYSLASPAQAGALPAIADIRGLPVIDRGRVYAISHSGRFAAIDQRSGDRVWEADIGGINTPVVNGDSVFVYGGDGQLIALARENGRAIWVAPLPQHIDPNDKTSDALVWAGPVLAGEKLWMVNSQGVLASFSPEDGSPADTVDLGAPLYLPPVVADRTFYIVTDEGTLVALR